MNNINQNELLTFLKKRYSENTANSIYNKIKSKFQNVGNYELQGSRSLAYIASRHPSVFEETLKYDNPRDIICRGEELSGGYDHWFKIPVNEIDEYILTVQNYLLSTNTENDITDENYWNEIEAEDNHRVFQCIQRQDETSGVNKSKLNSIQSKKLSPYLENSEIAKKVWNLRQDFLCVFFKSLSENKTYLKNYSELDNAIIKDLIDKICEKLQKSTNWDINNFKKMLPPDIVENIELEYPQTAIEVFEKIYDVLEKENLNIEPLRLIRALLLLMNGDISIWDEALSTLSPEEIIVHIEYENGIRVRNLNAPLNTEFIDDDETDTVRLLAMELYDNNLPF